jgi:hypothetical protein
MILDNIQGGGKIFEQIKQRDPERGIVHFTTGKGPFPDSRKNR